MANVIENVIRGNAVLGIREPNDALAEWSNEQYQAGSRSVKLYKGGSGNAGSTHVQFKPINTVTLQDFQDDITGGQNGFSFYHREAAVTVANLAQFELRFESPTTEAWVEVTVVALQNTAGQLVWNQLTLTTTHDNGKGGRTPNGSSFFDWGLGSDLTAILADIVTLMDAAEAGSGTSYAAAMVLNRVRLELWEAEPTRTQFIDTVVIDGTAHPIEPGSVSPGLSLSSPFTDIGYTLDGVDIEYTVETDESKVAEETFPINRHITGEACLVRCTMKETTLENLKNAMAGAVLSGNILTLGGGVMKTLNLRIVATNPAGYRTEIFIPKATAIGAVAVSFKKDEDTMVPVEFSALKATNSEAVTIVYNAI